jgi:hypothetical protein
MEEINYLYLYLYLYLHSNSCLLQYKAERGGGGGEGAWKPADLLLYAVPVFENYPQFGSHPKQAKTGVSGYGLDWKWAFWACFHENDHFHAQNWVYKFGHDIGFSQFKGAYTAPLKITWKASAIV